MATQSAASTFVASGARTAIEGGGFKNVFRDTAISFVAGGVMGTFMSASGAGEPPASFGDYVAKGSSSTLGYLHSPLSGGVQGSLRAMMYGGNMVEAFGDGAVSREALLDYAMASGVAPVAGWISSGLVAALPGNHQPVARPEVWQEPPEKPKDAPPLAPEEKFLKRVVKGSIMTVASHVRELVVAPARSLGMLYDTLTSETWRDRSQVINPFSRNFAGYQLLDGVTDAALVAGGLPVSFLSGDFLDTGWRAERNSGDGLRAVDFNGIANKPGDAAAMKSLISGIKGEHSAIQVTNGTHLFAIGDLIQAIGNEFGLIDITAIRGAEALRKTAALSPLIDVTAHSQGTMTFRRALDLVDEPGIRSRIQYQGYGPQAFINQTFLGLGHAENYWNRTVGKGAASGFDPVPLVNYVPSPAKVFGDPFLQPGSGGWRVVQSAYNLKEPAGNHHGLEYYAGYISR